MSAAQPHRVLFLTATLTSGGLERQLSLLAANLPSRWRPLVWSADGGPFRDVLARSAVPVIVDRRARRLDPRPFARLARLILCHRPDVVHAWHWMPAAVAAPVCRAAGIPFIDGTIRLGKPNPEFGRPRAAIMRLADVVVANSRAGLKAWGVGPPKGRVVYNAFDQTRLDASPADSPVEAGAGGAKAVRRASEAASPAAFTVVMTGRLHSHKDFRTLLSAARLVSAGAPAGTWRFLLVGDGPEAESLRRDAADLVEAGVVDFAAPGLEVLPLVATADVGVLLTDPAQHAEGCSNAIMEYMACGLPVIANDSGGNRELVEDGVTGFIVASGDAAGLARRLEELRGSAGRAVMGAAGRTRLLRDFSLAAMVDAYVRIYEECVRDLG